MLPPKVPIWVHSTNVSQVGTFIYRSDPGSGSIYIHADPGSGFIYLND